MPKRKPPEKVLELIRRYRRDYRYYFRKCLKIRDKNSNVIPFKTNPSQDRLVKIVEDWLAKYPDKKTRPTLYTIILKARQIGFSTTTEGIFFHDLNFGRDLVAMIVSYDDDSAQNIQDMSARFYQYLPQPIKPLSRPYRGKGILFENPRFNPNMPVSDVNHPGLQNKFLIETARNVYAGSSYTIMRLHISEIAKWPNPEDTMTSLMQAVPDYGAIVVVESTANGLNYFYELWQKAEDGENNYTTLFIPWFEHKDYRVDFVSDKERERFANHLDQFSREDGVDYRDMIKTYGLTLEQAAWYRQTLRDKCASDVNKMRQEYPSCSEEAFISSGRPVFDNEKVLNRKKALEKVYKDNPPLVGRIECDCSAEGDPIAGTQRLVPDPNGWLTVYEEPKPGHPYVLGGDIAEGGADWSTGQVINNITGNQAATWRAHTNTDLYAKHMFALGLWYNEALISIETNFDTHPVKELTRLGYFKQYFREKLDTITNQLQRKFGFKTTTASRPPLIGGLVTVVRESVELINDLGTLGEMLTFVRNDDGKPEAQSGKFDDLVLGLAIAHRCRGQQSMTVSDKGPESFLPGSDPGQRRGRDFDTDSDDDDDEERDDAGFYAM